MCCASSWWRSLQVQRAREQESEGARKQGSGIREQGSERRLQAVNPLHFFSRGERRKSRVPLTPLTPLAPPTPLPLKSPSTISSTWCAGQRRLDRFRELHSRACS